MLKNQIHQLISSYLSLKCLLCYQQYFQPDQMKRKISTKNIGKDVCIELLLPKVSERYSSWHTSKRILSLNRTPQHLHKEKNLQINRFNNSLLTRQKRIKIERVGTKNPLSLIKLDNFQQNTKPQGNPVIFNQTRMHNIADSDILTFQRFKQRSQSRSLSSHKTIQAPETLSQQGIQKPVFTIKLLKAFLKNYQAPKKYDFSKITKRSETQPFSQSPQKQQLNNFSFSIKNINEMELQANKIMLKHSFTINQQSPKPINFKTNNTPVKRQHRLVKALKQTNLLSQRECLNYQTLQPAPICHKKYSQDISEDLFKISDSLICHNNSYINPEPSISAWN